MELMNKRLSDDEFFSQRQEVLQQWPTGKDASIDEGIAFHKSLPEHKVFTHKLNLAKKNGRDRKSVV